MTVLLCYRNLKARGIVRNWTTLRNRIRNDGFPAGRMTGRNERTWTEAEIDEWIASCPVAGPAPRAKLLIAPRRSPDAPWPLQTAGGPFRQRPVTSP